MNLTRARYGDGTLTLDLTAAYDRPETVDATGHHGEPDTFHRVRLTSAGEPVADFRITLARLPQ